MMKFKRFMNFRPFLFVALTLIVSSVIATFLCVLTNVKLIVGLCLVGIATILVVLFAVFKKKFLMFAGCLVFCASFVFMNLYFRANGLDNNLKFNDKEIFISGVISDNISTTTSGNIAITIDSVHIVADDGNYEIDGKVKIYTSFGYFDAADLEVGRKIEAFGTLNFKSTSANLDKYVGNFSKGEVAGGFVAHDKITITDEYHKTISSTVKNGVLDLLEKSDAKHTEVGYAMLFGDTSFIDNDIKNIFQTTGIAHLLAVSGFHVSVIAFAINFVLSRFNRSKSVNFIIVSILLFIYSYLCDFSVSVVRASLMSVLMLYAGVRGKPYDKLSVLSLVASFLLLLNPLYLFNLSFILSFVAVVSIFLLAKPFERLFDKVFYHKVASSFALNLAVQIGLFAFSVYFFGKYEVLGIFCNLISVPIASIAFVILVFSVIISSVLPFMSFLMHGYGFLMDIVVKFNYAVSRLGWTLRFGTFAPVVMVLAVVLMFVLSDYVILSKPKKAIVSAVPLGLMALFVFI